MTTEFGYPRRQYSGCRQIDLVLKEGHSDQSPCLACHEIRWQRECAGRNASERRASLEKDNAQADPMGFSGKADTAGVNERSSTPSRCAGVVATACTQGKRTQHGKPQGVVREDQPDAREGQIGRLGASRVAYAFLVYMLSPLPRRSGWAYCFAHSPQPYQPSPKTPSGRPAHCPFRGLLGVHLRYGLHTRAATVFRDTLSEGFSHFVTSMTAPVASGWSSCRVGFSPTGKRRLYTAHRHSGHCLPLARIGSVAIGRVEMWRGGVRQNIYLIH